MIKVLIKKKGAFAQSCCFIDRELRYCALGYQLIRGLVLVYNRTNLISCNLYARSCCFFNREARTETQCDDKARLMPEPGHQLIRGLVEYLWPIRGQKERERVRRTCARRSALGLVNHRVRIIIDPTWSAWISRIIWKPKPSLCSERRVGYFRWDLQEENNFLKGAYDGSLYPHQYWIPVN